MTSLLERYSTDPNLTAAQRAVGRKRQPLSDDILQRQREYWRRMLQGAPMLLELPTDRPRPAHQKFAGGVVQLELDANLTAGLKALSQRHDMTLHMTILAGWAAVLSRLSGQDEIVIGTRSASRASMDGSMGFSNPLALRIPVAGTVDELLEGVSARAMEAQENQDLTFAQVMESVKAPRNLSHTPIFQVMLAWGDSSGMRPSPLDMPRDAVRFDLDLDLCDIGDCVVGELRYATALYDRATIERQVGYLRRMLTEMVADASQNIDRIDILGDQERHQLLFGWNATRAYYPKDRCIHQLFEGQVAQSPDAVALEFEEQTLSYAELNRQANRLAHHLRNLGVKPDDRVAICMERSLEMIVGILAVLKAGGAYVPLDPGYPVERLAYMLDDSAPVALLTRSDTRGTLQTADLPALMLDLPVVTLDLPEQKALIARQPAHCPHPREIGLEPHHVAYVIYTSGSTGQPKGVLNEHHALVDRLTWAQKALPLGPADRVLQQTPVSFDVSVWEILHPLLAGATLVMARPQGHKDPEYLARVIENRAITTLHFCPSMLQLFLEQFDEDGAAASRFPSLRCVLSAGEALGRSLQRRMHATLPHVELHNLYGPTEAAIYATWCKCDPHTMLATVPIGRPLDNTQIYILDKYLRPVPVGVAGEIYIGGPGVARGYLNRPELTAERFVEDPFAAQPARMYKTGDLGRWLPDKRVDYIGRNDFQVKIHGIRIELGEIEMALGAHPGVEDSRVVVLEFGPLDKRLVAYVVPSMQRACDADTLGGELREHLQALLPHYMVPMHYVLLDEFPLTPNGKLDRRALPAPDVSASVKAVYEAPVGELESTLANIWKDVLKVERIGRHDNFFELGGHSLSATRVIWQLSDHGVEIPVGALLDHPTVHSLAEYIDSDLLVV